MELTLEKQLILEDFKRQAYQMDLKQVRVMAVELKQYQLRYEQVVQQAMRKELTGE